MSNLKIFKIGIGPSSSHTLGPLVAGNLFCEKIRPYLEKITRIKIRLYGSLSLTGRGHLSDKAILWGLSFLEAKRIKSEDQEQVNVGAFEEKYLNLCGEKKISFDPKNDLIFEKEFLKEHENALQIEAFNGEDLMIKERYFSIGGGFVLSEEEMKNTEAKEEDKKLKINTAKEALELCENKKCNLAKLSLEYEKQFHSEDEIKKYCLQIWEAMEESFERGKDPKNAFLPGPLKLKRRAPGMNERVKKAAKQQSQDPMNMIDLISLYAISIAEENAAGARVVSAPTNGACAVIPAVMLYLKNHVFAQKNGERNSQNADEELGEFDEARIVDFLLVAMLIGSFYKKNASISGAEAGCQAEIGSAASMAAGAMATVLGADGARAASAAEVAMEHHLGLTCDPVAGLVQIPCIERNAFGAIKAISAARLAMTRKSTPRIALDEVIKTMFETGKDMNYKYKETSLGGLAKTMGGSVC